jgi:hypothetical protein
MGANQAQADTYEMGPFTVTGFGPTDSLAEADAYGEAWDIIIGILDDLPEGHVMIDFVIESGVLLAPGVYELQFHIVIEYDPFAPSGGGGQAGGGPGA